MKSETFLFALLAILFFGCTSISPADQAGTEKNVQHHICIAGLTDEYYQCLEKTDNLFANCIDSVVTYPATLVIRKISITRKKEICEIIVKYEKNPETDYNRIATGDNSLKQFVEKIGTEEVDCDMPVEVLKKKEESVSLFGDIQHTDFEYGKLDRWTDQYCKQN